ncbi:BNR-4 repeat-containing protein [Pedobacter sp. MC2016-24]|uniref:BNR-4 repeat-containing protein n=1 Tax=Pedobacter sp. MC2016-24 TaxID=2780090 RepID=UPI001D16C2E5|nr:BNR-4 repeat-containing protein [Pedobacter sp. MC2016-24]
MNNPIFNLKLFAKALLFFCMVLCAAQFCKGQQNQLTTIASNGWANNSVNAVIFRKNSLVTAKGYQYAAYYDSDQNLVLAKRKSGGQDWIIEKTQYKGDATDAHKSISIMVDGAGFVHVAWGQHNNALNYARSEAPGTLKLGGKLPMTSAKESKVSYPEFYKLVNGDLLFFYRDGGSGNGNLMINRYDLRSKNWSRVQDGMIDGEGKRNAYWQMAVDATGTLHLSWVWRESPDVASNHDLCYAKSLDGGLSWQKSTGEVYQLPITASNAEYALKIPQKSELINQTAMYADAKGRVFIVSYWNTQPGGVPQYHIVFNDGKKWKVNDLSFRKTAFSLSGSGTKKIPISRPQIIAWPNANGSGAGILFRDAERGNKASIAINQDLDTKDWKVTDLTSEDLGDWEPSYDTELWKDKSVLNLYVQNVIQIDGEGKADAKPSPVQVLEWKPGIPQSLPSKKEVLNIIDRANGYWQSNNKPEARSFWDNAAYHTGNMEVVALTGNENYRKYSEDWATHNQWMGAKSTDKRQWKYKYGETDDYVLFGDWQICFQTYIDLYHLNPEAHKIARAKEVMEYQMSTPSNEYWWWADGLYMVMPVMTKLYKATGNQQYLDKLYAYFMYANSIMYDKEEKLYYRDAKYVYPKHKSAQGKKDFWARGDGWVFAGLAKVLNDLPLNDPHRNEYLGKYMGMARAILASQQSEGYWTRSMLDPEHAPGPETSGTAFFTYGLLWGINHGYLKEKDFLPAALKGWNFLASTALQESGKVGYVQPIGEKAIPGQIVDANSTANFGVGAFLLANCELYRYLKK